LELDSGVKYGLIASCAVISTLIAAFLLLQIKGIFAVTVMRLMKFFKKEKPEAIARMQSMDAGIRDFYFNRKRSFFVSIWWHLLARVIATFDAMFILYFMGIRIDLLTAFFIQTISVLINLLFMFIPLQIGAAEGGHYALFSAIARDPVDGVEFSLIRRLRGIIWIAIGLVIMVIGKKKTGDR
ncbi:MAG: flippase-like domain-containing protein, partial [Deltaproteobacteria bacterium]|nr:flippase-like domain-containing protein [Deltaproteobacteria bacterium]